MEYPGNNEFNTFTDDERNIRDYISYQNFTYNNSYDYLINQNCPEIPNTLKHTNSNIIQYQDDKSNNNTSYNVLYDPYKQNMVENVNSKTSCYPPPHINKSLTAFNHQTKSESTFRNSEINMLNGVDTDMKYMTLNQQDGDNSHPKNRENVGLRPSSYIYNSNDVLYSRGTYHGLNYPTNDHCSNLNTPQQDKIQNNLKMPYSTGHSPVNTASLQNSDNDYFGSNINGIVTYNNNRGASSVCHFSGSEASYASGSDQIKLHKNKVNNPPTYYEQPTNASYSQFEYKLLPNKIPYKTVPDMGLLNNPTNIKHGSSSTTCIPTTVDGNMVNSIENYTTSQNFTNYNTYNFPSTTRINASNYDYTPNTVTQATNQNIGSFSTPDLYLKYSNNNNNNNNNRTTPSYYNQDINTTHGFNSPSDFVVNIANIKSLNVPTLTPENNDIGYRYEGGQCFLPNIDHISSTLNTIPKKNKELTKLGLPFGVVYTPFKFIKDIPLIFPKEITRCAKCLAYLNPFSTWAEPMKFVCVMCGRHKNLSTNNFIDMTDPSTNNPAIMSYVQSPMLQICMTYCTYEVVAPPSFCVSPPKSPCYIFLMDMTFQCVSTGYLRIFIEGISEHVLSLCPNGRCSIAFIGYNQFIHVFGIKNNNDSLSPKTVHHVISDIDEFYQPFDDEMFIFPTKNINKFRDFLKTLPEAVHSYVPNIHGASCMANALKFCIRILEKTGGKIILFNATPPTIGEGVVHPPELKMDKSTEDLIGLPSSGNTFYKSLGLDACKKSICIDFFYIGFESYTPLVDMITMISNCGGTYKYFSYFEKSCQLQFQQKFKSEFNNYCSNKFTIDNLVVVRSSRGIEIESYYGNFMLESTGKLIIPYLNERTTLTIKFEVDDIPFTYNGHVYVQTAWYYTNPDGERRIRITTLPLKIAPDNSPITVYHNANEFAIATLISRIIHFHLLSKSKLADVRDATFNSCKQILMSFYTAINTKFDGRNLFLHKNLQHLFCFVHSLLNHPFLSNDVSCMGIDGRISHMEFLKNCNIRDLISRLYPKLYCFNNLEYYPLEDLIGDDPQKSIQPIPPTAQFINQQYVYLLDSGNATYLLVPRALPANYFKLLFNCYSFDDLPHHIIGLPSHLNELNLKLRNVIDGIVSKDKIHSYNYQSTVISKVDTNNICSFYNHLIFDRRPKRLCSLNEFYSQLKESIIIKPF